MLTKTAILAGFGAGVATVAAQNSTSACLDYVIVSTRGTFEAQGPSIGFKEMISWTLGNVTNGAERDTVYPAAENQTFYLGANDITNYLDSEVQRCPDQRYALLGYSQGASVTGAALQNYTDTTSAVYKAIQAVLVIGNPYKIPNKDSDVDQNGGTSNRDLRGSLYNATLPDEYGNGIPDIYYADGKLLDICFDEDPICAPASKNATLEAHVLYGGSESVQSMGAKFLISKFTATNSSSNSSTGSATTSGGGGGATATSSSAASSTPAFGTAVGLQVPTSTFVMVLALFMGVVTW